MRFPFAPLVAALLIAGCFGGGDDDGGSATTPTPTTPDESPTPTTPTGGSPTPGTPPGNETPPTNETPSPTPTTPTPTQPPVEVVNTTFDYASGEAAEPEGHTETFSVPEGYATVTFTIRADTEAGPGLPDLSVNTGDYSLLNPDGEEVASGVEDQEVAATAVPGEWKIVYTGTGNAKVTTVGVAEG